ncbi:Alpha/Beta hydrolase protein [Aspergillus californicus]
MVEYKTKELVSALGLPSEELQQLLGNLPPRPKLERPPASVIREYSNNLEQANYDKTPTLGTTEFTIPIPLRDGSLSDLRICKPPAQTPEALVLLIYGGGMISGTNKQLIQFARLFATLYNVAVALPSYRLAPEHKFPTAPADIWDCVTWLRENAKSHPALSADLEKGFVIAGVSAGANLAVVAAHRAAREALNGSGNGNPSPFPFTGLWAAAPGLFTDNTVDDNTIIPEKYRHLWLSRTQNAHAPVLGAAELTLIGEYYAPESTDDYTPFRDMGTFSPRVIPRTYVQVCGMDPLRDDGLVYERALRDNGVQTRLNVYPGMPHGHWVAFPHLVASRQAILDAVREMGWLLGGEVEGGNIVEVAREIGLDLDL